MACRDDHPNDDYEKLNERTNQLCAQLRMLESVGREDLIVGEAREWWEEHKRRDRLREMQEELNREECTKREAALNKLSAEERALLGLK